MRRPVHLDLLTIGTTGRKSSLPVTLEGTRVARAIIEAAEARGRERGQTEGRVEGAVRVLVSLLTKRLPEASPPDSPRWPRHLAAELEPADAVARIQGANAVDHLELGG